MVLYFPTQMDLKSNTQKNLKMFLTCLKLDINIAHGFWDCRFARRTWNSATGIINSVKPRVKQRKMWELLKLTSWNFWEDPVIFKQVLQNITIAQRNYSWDHLA